jgi:phosphonate metabolism protein (transferase hexapeptide repeat family)
MNQKMLSSEPLIHETARISECEFGAYTDIGAHSVMQNVRLGDYSYACQFCIFQNAVIGKFSNIAAAVRIGPTMHPLDRPTLHHFTYRRMQYGLDDHDDEDFFAWRRTQTAFVGHDTWIGHGAIIMPNVHVGHGAIIGSGGVVTKDVPPFAVAVGVPARVIRQRFPDSIAEALTKIAWWDWDHKTIKERLRDFTGGVEEFVEKYSREGVTRDTHA